MLENIVIYTKDENENLRIMSMGAISKMISSDPEELLGIDSQLEVRLVDGVLYAFQEQSVQPKIYLESFGAVALALGELTKMLHIFLFKVFETISQLFGR